MNDEELPTPPLVERTSLPLYISPHCMTFDADAYPQIRFRPRRMANSAPTQGVGED